MSDDRRRHHVVTFRRYHRTVAQLLLSRVTVEVSRNQRRRRTPEEVRCEVIELDTGGLQLPASIANEIAEDPPHTSRPAPRAFAIRK